MGLLHLRTCLIPLFACFVFGHIQRWPRCFFFCGQNAGITGICVSCVFVLREQLSAKRCQPLKWWPVLSQMSLNHLKDGKKWWNKNPGRWRALEVNSLKITTINWWSNFWAGASSIRLEHRTPVLVFFSYIHPWNLWRWNVENWFTLNHSMWAPIIATLVLLLHIADDFGVSLTSSRRGHPDVLVMKLLNARGPFQPFLETL